jgi:rubrerythrin
VLWKKRVLKVHAPSRICWNRIAGESQARTRYTFFASVAKKEGYEQIAGVFMETAEQEKEHANGS